jgi:sugar phosphate isomerase/epimerase
MIGQFGVSTSICAGDARRVASGDYKLSEEDIVKGYISLLEDFARFTLGNHFEIIEIEFGFSLISAKRLYQSVDKLKEIIRPFHTVSCHLPIGEINISAINSLVRRNAIAETKRHIDLCVELGISKLVIHPGSFASMPDRYLLLEGPTREIARHSVFEIYRYCNKRDMELSIENLHCNEPFFQEPDEFEPFIRRGIGMTLDSVHAFSSGVDPLDFIRKFGKKVTEVHLTDGVRGDPISDCPVGSGMVDCLGILQALEEMEFDGMVILEVLSRESLIKSKTFLEGKGYLK